MLNKLFRRRPLIEELEPRILFSADLAPLAFDSLAPVPEQRTIQSDGEFSSVSTTTRNELIIVDTRVDGYETLLNDILNQAGRDRQFSVVLLDSDRDGIEQITDALKQYGNLDALHLISHGDAGLLQLGNSQLDLAALNNRSAEVASWGTAFGAEGDLLIYGCDVAAGDAGEAFLNTLARLTGADVATSTDRTGTRSLGGNWALEFSSGRIESAALLAENNTLNWMGTLAITQSGVNSTASSGAVTSVSFSHSVNAGSDRLLIVELVKGETGVAVQSVQYNGTNLNLLVSKNSSGQTLQTQIWYLVAPTVGSSSVVVTVASPVGIVAGASTFYGVDQTTPFGATGSDFQNNAAATVSVTSNTGEVVIDVVGTSKATSSTSGAGQTTLFSNSQGSTSADLWAVSSTKQGAAGTVTLTQTLDNGGVKWASVGASIRPSAGIGNTAPNLDSSKSPVMQPVAEDAGAPVGSVGTLVSSLVDFASPAGQVDNVTDPDAGAQLGIAVTGADTTNGSWFYTIDNGTTWNALGSVSDASARLLEANANTRLYFQPNANYNGTLTSALTFRAWDRTTGAQGGLANTSANGGSTAFSTATDTASLTVTAVNDPPVITSNGGGVSAAISIPENTVFVTTVTATDVDVSPPLIYSISGGADATKFTINSSSGVLQFVTAPNYEAPTDSNGDNIYLVVVQVSDGSVVDTQSLQVTVTDVSSVSGVASGTLLFTTATAQSPAAGGSIWNAGQVLQYGNSGDYFDINGGTTTGTVDLLSGFTAPVPVRGMHYVQTAITIGTSGTQFNLNPGDLLLVLDPGGGTVTLNTGDAIPANDFAADRQDIVVYRPSVAGNYSSGEYFMLLDNGVQNGGTAYNVHALSLVETATTIGGKTLSAGTFIVAHSTPAVHYNIYTFDVTGTGQGASTQTSNTSLLLNGAALSSSTSQIQGLHLLSEATSFNDTVLAAGTLLVAVNGTNANYGGVAQDTYDIIALSVTQTQQDASPGTAATGQMLFDGSDLGLSSSNINGFTVVTNAVTNSAPVAIADTTTAVEAGGIANGTAGTNPTGNVLTNDTDSDSGDTKTVTAFSFGATPGVLSSALTGNYGSLTLNAAGNYSYVVNNNNAVVQALRTASNSLTETFNYTMRDTAGATSSTTLTITITGSNDAPVAVADTAGVTQNALISRSAAVGVLSNDTDVDTGDSKLVTGVSGTAGSTAVTNLSPGVLTNTYGTLTLNDDGAYSYLANGAASRALLGGATHVEVFTYTMRDTAGATNSTTLTITITGSNDAPIAVADTATAVEAGGVANGTAGTNPSGNVLTNDNDTDTGDTQTVTAFSFGATPGVLGSALAGSYGSLTLNAAGNYSYVVDNNNAAVQALRTSSNTLTETFDYTMQDSAGAISSTTLTITITGSNDAPVAVADTATAVEAGGVANGTAGTNPGGNVLTNDTDVDSGDTQTVTAFSFGATPGTLGNALTGSYGSLTLNAAGNYSYVVDNNNAVVQALRTSSNTLTETFNYTMQDSAGAASSSTLTITITGSNDTPTNTPVTLTPIAEDSGGRLITQAQLLANASDVDDAVLTATSLAISSGSGVLVDNLNGTWTYTPALNDDTSVNFSYVVTDGSASVAGSAMLDITPVNDAPVITSNAIHLAEEESPASLTVTATDSEGDLLSFALTGGADAALFTIDASTGVLRLNFIPDYENPRDANRDNIYEVAVTVSDGNGGTASLAIQLVVTDKVEAVASLPAAGSGSGPVADSGTPDKDADADSPSLPLAPTNPAPLLNKNEAPPINTEQAPTISFQAATATAPAQYFFDSAQMNRGAAPATSLLATLNQALGSLTTDARALQMLQTSLGNSSFQQQLDKLQDTIRQQLSLDKNTIASTLAVSTGLSVGYVLWLVRGGVLLSSLLTSMPAWRLIDPLPILGHLGTRKHSPDEDDSLEGMLKKSNAQPAATPANTSEVVS